MSCNECVHQPICNTYARLGVTDLPASDITPCDLFKSKADLVEVVRCKDCKYWNCVGISTKHMGCSIFCGAYEREYPTNPEDFCSYGERKDT